ATVTVTGHSRRGLTVQRSAQCFYQPDGNVINSPDQLGRFTATFPSDTYDSFEVSVQNKDGEDVLFANDLRVTPAASFTIFQNAQGANINVKATNDRGDEMQQAGITGAVDKELKIFVPAVAN